MKKLYTLLLLPFLALGQSQDQNHIRTTTYKVATGSSLTNPNAAQAVVQVSYFDGLGRPLQQVAHQQASNGGDIITPMAYDSFGRQVKEYLPYVRTSGSKYYDASGLTAVENFYATNNLENTGNPAFATTLYPWSQKELESSPLNRVLKQAAPGDVWYLGSTKEIKFDYQANVANEVRYFKAQTTWDAATKVYNPTLTNIAPFAQNELYKTITKDENWTSGNNNTTQEFKNKLGQVVLKRTFSDVTLPSGAITQQVPHDTYYVYDEYGNLTYVIPPLVNTGGAISTNDLDGLCYQYKYDARNRLVEKKLPGKAWEFIVYDKLDRPVYTGPALNPFDGIASGWNITKYDAFGRVVYTGWLADAAIGSARRYFLQNEKNGETTVSESKTTTNATIDGITIRYSNNTFPKLSLKLLTINYYDNYSYPNAPVIPAPILGQTVLSNAKGLPTGSWVRVLNLTGTPIIGERSYTLYDVKGRAIRSYTLNHLGGFTQNDMQLDFIGQVLATIITHQRSATVATVTTNEYFEYTEQGRLRNHYHQINGGDIERLTTNDYDYLGQLITKDVGGAQSMQTGLQKVNYKYNIRGWLTEINEMNHLENNPGQFDDLFAFKINYDQVENPLGGDIKKLYNGNISETFWQTASDFDVRKYGYKYDQLNRLQSAVYQKPEAINPIRNSYNESLWYDKNGNITALQRNGEIDDINNRIEIDKLTYIYDSSNKNRLSIVDDSSNITHGFKDDDTHPDPLVIDSTIDYTYDDYGNMKTDTNKGITIPITYNHLNLPIKINLPNGIIEYLYNAVGVKLEKKVTIGSTFITTDYLSGYQYVDGGLQFFPHAEGYVNVVINRNNYHFNYVYNYTDHLGNIRVSYGLEPGTNALKILEENHYYPFGLKHKNYGVDMRKYQENGLGQIRLPLVSEVSYKYKYNGKELQDELGLNVYAYGWRDYDPAIGRFTKIDRFAEKYHKLTPYGYAGNNPVLINDVQGDSLWISFGKNEKVLYENGKLLSQGKDGKFSEYKGDKAKFDKKTGAIKGYKGFLGQAVSALNTLTSKAVGNDLVTSIQESTSNVTIEQSSTGNRYDPNTSTVEFDPNSMNGDINARGSTSRPPFIGLGHEMAHGLDDINGTLNTSLIPGYSKIKEAEKFATHIENQLRNEHNIPLRTHYRYLHEGTVIESLSLLNGRIKSAHYPNFNYGGLNSSISPAPAISSKAQTIPTIIINIQQ